MSATEMLIETLRSMNDEKDAEIARLTAEVARWEQEVEANIQAAGPDGTTAREGLMAALAITVVRLVHSRDQARAALAAKEK